MATEQGPPEPAQRVILWGVPMCLSTLFTRCIGAADGVDSEIFVEPYDNCHSFGPERRRPAWPDALASAERRLVNGWQTYARAKAELEADRPGASLVFVKDMAFAVDGKYDTLPVGYRHTFLVRDPRKVWSAYRRRIAEMLQRASTATEGEGSNRPPSTASEGEGSKRAPSTVTEEEGDKRAPPASLGDLEAYVSPTPVFKASYALMEHARTVLHQEPIVVDADDFARQPAATLQAYCSALGLPYSDSMLAMDSGSGSGSKWHCSEFFSWGAQHGGFYAKAMQSTQIQRPERDGHGPGDDPLAPEVAECVARSQEWYDRMYALRLQPE